MRGQFSHACSTRLELRQEIAGLQKALQDSIANGNSCSHRVTAISTELDDATALITELKTECGRYQDVTDKLRRDVESLQGTLTAKDRCLTHVKTQRDCATAGLATATAQLDILRALPLTVPVAEDVVSQEREALRLILIRVRKELTEVKVDNARLELAKDEAVGQLEGITAHSGGYLRFWQHIIQVPPDGIRGPVTEKGTVEWKHAHGLNPDTRCDYSVWDEVTRCCRVATPHLNTLLHEVANVVKSPTITLGHLRLATAYHDYLCTQAPYKAPQ